MINNTIGYIITEGETSNSASMQLTPKTIRGKVVGKGIIQTANEKNRNGRWYSKDELFPQLTCPRITELINTGTLIAQAGHPIGPDAKDLQVQSTLDPIKRCARFLKLWTEGMDIWSEFVGTNNDLGKAFDEDLKEGILPAWSLRALGSIEQTPRGAEVKNLRIITWDSVYYPSHQRAYTQGLVYESAGVDDVKIKSNKKVAVDNREKAITEAAIYPIINENIVNFLQSQSSNLKFVRECCDFMYNDIQVNENGTKVILSDKNNGDTMVINMESYIHNELMTYATEFQNKYN